MEYGMPDRRLHHVGYVVTDIATGMQGFIRSLGATWDEKIFEDPHQKVKVAFLSTGSGDALIELVEPATVDSPVRRFLEQKGGGLHHVCYEVLDLEQRLSVMKGNGAMLVRSPKPAVAFDGRRIAWVLTRERLLVELLESASRV
jgi:methylmalonyl-CoA/ethylmalonyl-CoA epimerase